MLTAILTDIHANKQALTACLAHAEQHHAEKFAFLGDFVGYGGDPGWVIDTVSHFVKQGAVAVMGNHDHAIINDPGKKMHMEAREVIDWTRGQLNHTQLDFLRTLPMKISRDGILYVHASANVPEAWTYITDVPEAAKSMKASTDRIIFSGHVHMPALYRTADDGKVGTQQPIPGKINLLRPQHQYLVLPGSVGQPRDNNPLACYALYNTASRELVYYRIPYDISGAARRVIEIGLPIVFAMRLVEGI
jgi:diadenosine tetraphosphatase ApaH/serine/threonine PP2A family protein phosphatase